MFTHSTLKASPVTGQEIDAACIAIVNEIDRHAAYVSLDDQRVAFTDEATKIVDVMYRHMPGGLVDHIFAELAKRKASIFHVPLKD